jgi:hypothetical protein
MLLRSDFIVINRVEIWEKRTERLKRRGMIMDREHR